MALLWKLVKGDGSRFSQVPEKRSEVHKITKKFSVILRAPERLGLGYPMSHNPLGSQEGTEEDSEDLSLSPVFLPWIRIRLAAVQRNILSCHQAALEVGGICPCLKTRFSDTMWKRPKLFTVLKILASQQRKWVQEAASRMEDMVPGSWHTQMLRG